MRGRKILISCEHAGNYIPKDYQTLFPGAGDILSSHRGWDPGALGVAKYLARHLEAPLFYQKISRLLIEMNRSVGNKELFSEFTRHLNVKDKDKLMHQYYYPYREEIARKVNGDVKSGDAVLHISIHTFTPVLNGVERTVDVGILFDDAREEEGEYCEGWKRQLESALPEMLVMLNCPYHGAEDGLTTFLRTKFSDQQYFGIELEINQKYVETDGMGDIKNALVNTLLRPDRF